MKPNPTIEALKTEIAALEAEYIALPTRLSDARNRLRQIIEAEQMAKPLTPAMKKALLAMLAGGKIERYRASCTITSDAGQSIRVLYVVFNGLRERQMIVMESSHMRTSYFTLTEHGKQAAEKLAAAESEAA